MPRRPRRAVSQVRAFSLCSSSSSMYIDSLRSALPTASKVRFEHSALQPVLHPQAALLGSGHAVRLQAQIPARFGVQPAGLPVGRHDATPEPGRGCTVSTADPRPCAGAEHQAQRARERCLPLTCTAHTKTSHGSVMGFRTIEATCRKLITRHKLLFSSILNHWSVCNHLCLCKL